MLRSAIIHWQLDLLASVAQPVEQLIRNQQVVCSSHIASSRKSTVNHHSAFSFCKFFKMRIPAAGIRAFPPVEAVFALVNLSYRKETANGNK